MTESNGQAGCRLSPSTPGVILWERLRSSWRRFVASAAASPAGGAKPDLAAMWSGLGTLGGRFDTPEAAAGGRSAERDARLHEELIPSKLSRILHGMVDVHRVLRAMHVGEALGDEEHRAAEGMASRSSKKAVSHREGGKEATRARTRFYTLAAIKSRYALFQTAEVRAELDLLWQTALTATNHAVAAEGIGYVDIPKAEMRDQPSQPTGPDRLSRRKSAEAVVCAPAQPPRLHLVSSLLARPGQLLRANSAPRQRSRSTSAKPGIPCRAPLSSRFGSAARSAPSARPESCTAGTLDVSGSPSPRTPSSGEATSVREAKDEASPAVLSRDQYLLMHRKMLLAIEPSISPKSAVLTAAEDWERDSEGKPFMDRARFDWCWFELADLWTNSMLVEDYVEFLQATRHMITAAEGQWEDDVVVIRNHFSRLKQLGNKEDPDNSLMLVLSRWYGHMRREVAAGGTSEAQQKSAGGECKPPPLSRPAKGRRLSAPQPGDSGVGPAVTPAGSKPSSGGDGASSLNASAQLAGARWAPPSAPAASATAKEAATSRASPVRLNTTGASMAGATLQSSSAETIPADSAAHHSAGRSSSGDRTSADSAKVRRTTGELTFFDSTNAGNYADDQQSVLSCDDTTRVDSDRSYHSVNSDGSYFSARQSSSGETTPVSSERSNQSARQGDEAILLGNAPAGCLKELSASEHSHERNVKDDAALIMEHGQEANAGVHAPRGNGLARPRAVSGEAAAAITVSLGLISSPLVGSGGAVSSWDERVPDRSLQGHAQGAEPHSIAGKTRGVLPSCSQPVPSLAPIGVIGSFKPTQIASPTPDDPSPAFLSAVQRAHGEGAIDPSRRLAVGRKPPLAYDGYEPPVTAFEQDFPLASLGQAPTLSSYVAAVGLGSTGPHVEPQPPCASFGSKMEIENTSRRPLAQASQIACFVAGKEELQNAASLDISLHDVAGEGTMPTLNLPPPALQPPPPLAASECGRHASGQTKTVVSPVIRPQTRRPFSASLLVHIPSGAGTGSASQSEAGPRTQPQHRVSSSPPPTAPRQPQSARQRLDKRAAKEANTAPSPAGDSGRAPPHVMRGSASESAIARLRAVRKQGPGSRPVSAGRSANGLVPAYGPIPIGGFLSASSSAASLGTAACRAPFGPLELSRPASPVLRSAPLLLPAPESTAMPAPRYAALQSPTQMLSPLRSPLRSPLAPPHMVLSPINAPSLVRTRDRCRSAGKGPSPPLHKDFTLQSVGSVPIADLVSPFADPAAILRRMSASPVHRPAPQPAWTPHSTERVTSSPQPPAPQFRDSGIGVWPRSASATATNLAATSRNEGAHRAASARAATGRPGVTLPGPLTASAG